MAAAVPVQSVTARERNHQPRGPKPAVPLPRTVLALRRCDDTPEARAMFLLRFLLKSVFAGLLARLAGRLFPVLARLLRTLWR